MKNHPIEFNSLSEFEMLDQTKILGEGAFSEVVAVKHIKTQKMYAMKKINLKTLSRADQMHLKDEIKLHKFLDHPNIIKFIASYQENEMVYFLLEYAANSCLFFYIHS